MDPPVRNSFKQNEVSNRSTRYKLMCGIHTVHVWFERRPPFFFKFLLETRTKGEFQGDGAETVL